MLYFIRSSVREMREMIGLSLDFNLFNNDYYIYERLLVLFFSLMPSILLVFIVLYTDRKSKEPKKNIILCLLSGILTTSLAGYFENLIAPYFSSNTLLTYIWATIEELSKMAIFFLFIFDNKYYDDIYDGLVYMSLIALSFAGVENVMYAFSESTVSSSIGLSLMRDLTTIPLHVICGIIIGFFLSLGTFSKVKSKKYSNFLLAALVSTLIHGTFNLLMGIMGSFNINGNNELQVFMFQFMPLLFIMIVLYYIAIKFIKCILRLNDTFIADGKYDRKYNYLMNYGEYLKSDARLKRLSMNKKTSILKRKDDADNA